MDARQQRPDWADLEVFLEVARSGSLAGAAERLQINSSTVGRRISRLEEALNASLFHRAQRGYSLTATGESLLPHVEAMAASSLALSRDISGQDQRLEGRIRVSTVDDLAVGPLAPILRDFCQQHPAVEVEINTEPSLANLSLQQADVAIRFGPKPKDPNVVVKHVSGIAAAIYASPDYLETHGRPENVDQLRGHRILRGSAWFAHLPFEQLLDTYTDESDWVMRTDSFLVRAAAIRNGSGIGFLSTFMGAQEPTLVRLPIASAHETIQQWILVHVDMRKNARVRAFVDHAYTALRAQRALFES